MARLLDVSRSGFYDWAARETVGPSAAQQRRASLAGKIKAFHAASDHVYGSPRILADLREDGEVVSGKTVAKLMRAHEIVGNSPRRWKPTTTMPGPDPAATPDLVKRKFDHGRLDAVWLSDITYLDTDEGWLYLCAVRDGHSRRVLGWAVEDHMRTDLVETALRAATVAATSRCCIDRLNLGSTHPRSSPTRPVTSVCSARWDAPACAGTTPRPRRSGPR